MAEESKIDSLRRRLQKDPASIAFAQLAEEYRRAGRYRDAIQTCKAGLAKHPGYLSARVTYGRALVEVGDLDGAQRELTSVVRLAPENLSAIRGLAEIHRRRGELPEALEQFKSAFDLAGRDPELEQILRDLRRDVADRDASPPAAADYGGLSLAPGVPATDAASDLAAPAARDRVAPDPFRTAASAEPSRAAAASPDTLGPTGRPTVTREPAELVRARRTVAYLERWLEAVVADRRLRLYGSRA